MSDNPPAQYRYKAAIIGVGAAAPKSHAKGGGHKIGYEHAEALLNIPGVSLTTAADINSVNLAAFQKTFSVSSGYEDYREMLERDRPDIVGICTYMKLHAQMIEDCVGAGVKIILCEKPFVSSPAELAKVRRLLAESGTTLGIAHIRRFKPNFVKARELVAGGAVGDPVMMFGGLGGWDLAEFGSHWIDLIRFLHGDQSALYVMGQARVRDGFGYGHRMEDHAIAYFEFADGCRGLVDGGRSFAPPEDSPVSPRSPWDIRVVGTEGFLTITEGEGLALHTKNGKTWHQAAPFQNLFEDAYRSLITEHETGEPSRCNFGHCAPSTEISLAAYLSALTRDRVDLPLSGKLAEFEQWPVDALAAQNTSSA